MGCITASAEPQDLGHEIAVEPSGGWPTFHMKHNFQQHVALPTYQKVLPSPSS